METVVYIDGGCSGNQLKDLSRRKMRGVVTDYRGHVLTKFRATGGSNNIAELRAVYEALMWCVEHHIDAVDIRTDSRNNFAWAKGKPPGLLIDDRDSVMKLQAAILAAPVAFRLVWVPREKNLAGKILEHEP